jgi:hypothetical protein
VRRLKALVLFTLGYALMALLSPAAAALPALLAFAVASFVLVRPAEPAAAEGLARERLRRR